MKNIINTVALIAITTIVFPHIGFATERFEHVMGICHFRIANMFGGSFNVPHPATSSGSYYLPATGPLSSPILVDGFGLDCVKSENTDEIAGALNAKRIHGKWLQYSFFDDTWVPFDKLQHARVIPLKSGNWTGTGILTDDTTGNEQYRKRIFLFCIVHPPQALCGNTPVAYLNQPKVNELWKVKAILNSIEFLDTSAPRAVQP